MALAGTFRQYPLPDVLQLIENGQQTGRLVVNGGGRVAHVYTVRGQWVHGERLGVGLSLAEQLVQAGLLTPQHLNEALGVLPEDTLVVPDEQLVQILISGGVLHPESVHGWAVNDAVAMLSFMLTWADGAFEFEEGASVPTGQLMLPLPLGQLLARAMHSAHGASGPQPAMPAAPAPPLQAAPVARDAAPLTPDVVLAFADVDPGGEMPIQITRDQWRLLTMVDGRLPLWAIMDALQAPPQILLRIAGELVAADLAVVVGRAAPGNG